MPVVFDITHTTRYLYSKPVRFGEHKVMFRPRASHDMRVLATDMKVSPQANVRLVQDVYANSVAFVQPLEAAKCLEIVCSFTVEHVGTFNLELPLDPSALVYPFEYSADDRFALQPDMVPSAPDKDGRLLKWARQFTKPPASAGKPMPAASNTARDVLVRMNQFIRDNFEYAERETPGTQSPHETLELGSGSCRDFAMLMIEAARRLGFAARFVSGYLYSPALDGDDAPGTVGAGATHAWLHVYLPGAGWVPFDPTNNLTGGTNLIRVGEARDAAHAAPVSGSWSGDPKDFIGMEVDVQVHRRA